MHGEKIKLTVRLSQEEHAHLKEQAAIAGLKMSRLSESS